MHNSYAHPPQVTYVPDFYKKEIALVYEGLQGKIIEERVKMKEGPEGKIIGEFKNGTHTIEYSNLLLQAAAKMRKKPAGVRWVTVNNGDCENPTYVRD